MNVNRCVHIPYTVPDAISVYYRDGASGLTNSAKLLCPLPSAAEELKAVYLDQQDWIAVPFSISIILSLAKIQHVLFKNLQYSLTLLVFLVCNSSWYKFTAHDVGTRMHWPSHFIASLCFRFYF